MTIQRQVMTFKLPLRVEQLGRSNFRGRASIPLYINPETFQIQERKVISSSMTKGGYAVQYWGEELASITANGTTGSGGIEAINILRDVYRYEIIHFNNLLRLRESNSQEDFISAFGSAGGRNRTRNFRNDIFNLAGGAESIINEIVESAYGFAEANPASVNLIPSIGVFATNIILYWHGEMFQGYFENFTVDEKAASPGLFDYSFGFKVLKRSGKRSNFMPWHRNPYDLNGNPRPASMPIEGARVDELTFESTYQKITSNVQENQNGPSNTNFVTSNIRESQSSINEQNNVGVNRRGTVRGK